MGWLEKLKDGQKTRKSDEDVRVAENNNLDCVRKTWILDRTFRLCRLFIRSLTRQRRILRSCHSCLSLSRQFRRCPCADFPSTNVINERRRCRSELFPSIVHLIAHPVTLTTSLGLVPGSLGTRRSINRKFEFSPNEYYVSRPLLSNVFLR